MGKENKTFFESLPNCGRRFLSKGPAFVIMNSSNKENFEG